MPKEHVHGPDCNHSQTQNPNQLAQLISMIQQNKPHVHGPNCNHAGEHQGHDHGHKQTGGHSHHMQEHQHGPNCNHSDDLSHDHGHDHHGEDPMIEWQRNVDASMKFIIQKPEEALSQLKTGNALICAGISELVRLGPQPDTLKLPHDNFKAGFAHYFSTQNLMPVLLKNSKVEYDKKGMDFILYLETILDLLYSYYMPNPPENSFIDQFVEAGGIEFISTGEEHPGSVVLQSKHTDIFEIGKAIKSTLVSTEAFKRKCFNVGCEKREIRMKQFNVCSRCW